MIYVNEAFIPAAWECALQKVYETGELPLVIKINDPIVEPRLHKYLPCSLERLKEYELEVTEGIKDPFIKSNGTTLKYTYHSRMKPQIPLVVEKMIKNPQTDQAIIILNRNLKDPMLLQDIQFRIRQNEFLDMKTHWWVSDLYNLWSMNVWAFTRFQEKILNLLGEADPKFRDLRMGNYIDVSNSAFIYEQDLKTVGENLKKWGKSFSKERSVTTTDPEVQKIFQKAELKISNGEPIYF